VAWSHLIWRKLAAADPLASLQSVVRTSVGFIAAGPPKSTESGFRTPLSISAAGFDWQALNPTAVGADAIVVGIYQVSDTLVALTMAGGAAPCQETEGNCLQVRPPLRAWTSTDGASWTFRAEPLTLEIAPDTGLLEDNPRAATTGDLLVIEQGNTTVRLAASSDGLTWALVDPTGLPRAFRGGLAGAAGGGFVLAGVTGTDEQTRPVVAWSADARNWESATLPISQRTVGSASGFAAARGGLILDVRTDVTPGGPAWWASANGRDWEPIADFAPLGAWNGEGEGSGVMPNGQLVADGERMVAYDTVNGTRAFTSSDGINWTPLEIAGDLPPATNGFPDTSASQLQLTELGLFWRDDQSNAWFAEPTTD
jgi:hypothetical protein